MYSYLDVDEIEGRQLFAVPAPVHKPLPEKMACALRKHRGRTGTLVLWTDFDDHRLSWRGALATLRNTESFVGRMYRKFIDDGRLSIRLLALLEDESDPTFDEPVRVNDPLYLMQNSSNPGSRSTPNRCFSHGVMKTRCSRSTTTGATHNVIVRMSWAREETVPEDRSDRGAKPYGKHAAKNIGLSIVREGRELGPSDSAWTNQLRSDRTLVGASRSSFLRRSTRCSVLRTLNRVRRFSRIWPSSTGRRKPIPASRGRSFRNAHRATAIRARFCYRSLITYATKFRKSVNGSRSRMPDAGRKKTGIMNQMSPTWRPQSSTREPSKVTKPTRTGKEFTEEDRESLEKDLKDDKYYREDIAQKIAQATFTRKRKVIFLEKTMEGYAFFNVEHKQGGLTEVVFNSNHPFHNQLIEALRPQIGDETDAELMGRIHTAADTLELLFAAWARYEMEETRQKNRLFEMRQEWGKMARFFLTEEDDE